jgi:2-keto-4-pentenoate hydratase
MTTMTHEQIAHALACHLWEAQCSGQPCLPLRQLAQAAGWPDTEANAYLVQRQLTARRRASGDTTVGRKVGLTTASVRRQVGVDQPDSGWLWSSTAQGDNDPVPLARYIQPKLEAEVALVLGRDIDNPDATMADLLRAVEYVVPALEIVDCRMQGWDVKLFDLVADNAAAAGFVLGAQPRRLDQVSLRDARMTLHAGTEQVASGMGQDCMGHPLNAAVWLARQAARGGEPLREGEIVLTGALGSMVAIGGRGRYEACIEGLGSVAVEFT